MATGSVDRLVRAGLPFTASVEVAKQIFSSTTVATVNVSTRTGNRVSLEIDGVYVPAVAEGDFPDMNIIFENALL